MKYSALFPLIDLLYPPNCVVCHRQEPFAADLLICAACQKRLIRGPGPTCVTCGASRQPGSIEDDRCARCRGVRFLIDRAVTLGEYDGLLREVIIELKHSGQEHMALQLGKLLGQAFSPHVASMGYQVMVAMPAHWSRRLARGANIAELLCEGASPYLELEAAPGMLKQTRKTAKQATLTRSQRIKNVKGAFAIRKGYTAGGFKILIVDDVLTSGATINEAARVLLNSGAAAVGAMLIARGQGSLVGSMPRAPGGELAGN